MLIRDTFLPEFDDEMGKTRKLLALVPVQDGDWTPHAKSMTLGHLASHIAAIPDWMTKILGSEVYDASGGAKEFHAASVEELVSHFDAMTSEARQLIWSADDEQLSKVWKFSYGGHPIFSRPRYQAIRILVMDHLIHHRGQLSVYLRLRDIPIPGMYGPSADEA